jgi:hypothetical protein
MLPMFVSYDALAQLGLLIIFLMLHVVKLGKTRSVALANARASFLLCQNELQKDYGLWIFLLC